jgi:hypothetical protein
MKNAAGAESGDSVKDRRAGKTFLAEPFEQGNREGLMMPLIRFADEDPGENLFAVENAHPDSFLVF